MGDQGVAVQQQLSLQMYRQPTLPHLLQEYGFRSSLQQQIKKNEKKENKKPEKKLAKRSGSFLQDDDRDLEKEKEMDEHYVKMVSDMYSLRDYYYNEYSALLAEKVENQRRKIRERDAQLKNALQIKEEEERKASHRVKKRHERHTLETTPVPEAVPKTDLYYIMGLEDKLRREGKLKNPSDFLKFRQDMNEPEIFYANFKVRKNADLTSYSGSSNDVISTHSKEESGDTLFEMVPNIAKKNPEQENQQLRPLSRISENRESPVPFTRRESWAVTQQFPSKYRSRKSISNIPSNPPKQKVDQLSDLEKRFPKLEMPKLHCFTLNLNKKPPDPEEVRQEAEIRAKEKGRRRAMRTYTKMYQLAMTNAATTSRIMDNFDDMNLMLQGPSLCDVIADHHWMQAYGLTAADQQEILRDSPLVEEGNDNVVIEGEGQMHPCPPEATQMVSHDHMTGSGSRAGSAKSEKSSGRKSRRSSGKSKRATPIEEMAKITPLTMDEIRTGCDIKESKTLSSMWNNYLKAGKSPWNRKEKESIEQV